MHRLLDVAGSSRATFSSTASCRRALSDVHRSGLLAGAVACLEDRELIPADVECRSGGIGVRSSRASRQACARTSGEMLRLRHLPQTESARTAEGGKNRMTRCGQSDIPQRRFSRAEWNGRDDAGAVKSRSRASTSNPGHRRHLALSSARPWSGFKYPPFDGATCSSATTCSAQFSSSVPPGGAHLLPIQISPGASDRLKCPEDPSAISSAVIACHASILKCVQTRLVRPVSEKPTPISWNSRAVPDEGPAGDVPASSGSAQSYGLSRFRRTVLCDAR